MNEACHLLEWDTAFFGFRIARVDADALDPGQVEQIERWCLQNQIRCLYFLARADDPQTARLAEDHNYRLMDVRMTFQKNLSGPHPLTPARPACPGDLPILKRIARASYHDTRFYFDAKFPRHLCDKLYESWIEQSCRGAAEAVLVMDSNEAAVGYTTCHIERDTAAGKIGLVGVSADARGQGVGQALADSALAWFAEQGMHTVTVVTQGRNVAAQRLYQRSGFLIAAIQLWYHKWFV